MGSILGTRVLRSEDPRFLTGRGSYIDNIAPADAAFITYVRSPIAHARIRQVDAAAAAGAPGVVAVFTADDLDLEPFTSPMPLNNPDMLRPWIASDVVRYVGEIVAVVVTEERYQGDDAAQLVAVDYEPLDVVVDPEAALTDELVLDLAAGTNISLVFAVDEPDDGLFDECEVVVKQRMVNNRIAPCPLEGRAALAVFEDGHLTQSSTTQSAHNVKAGLARILGLEPDQVRVVVPDVGGSFGAKRGLSPPELLVAWTARQIGRAARWHEGRSEGMQDLGHGRAQVQYATLGGDRDGTLKALKVELVQDAGAYPDVGSLLPRMGTIMGGGVYDLDAVEVSSRSTITNTVPLLAFRGAGRPEATAMIERMVDLFADEIDLDPVELRRKNLIPADAFPFTSATGAVYDAARYEAALDKALDAIDYAAVRARQAQQRAANDPKLLGVGVSTYVEITNTGVEGEYGAIEISEDGRALVKTGSVGQGHGHTTVYAMLASELTGIAFDDIEVVFGDTDVVPRGVGTGGSKSAQNGGSAVRLACDALVELARDRSASLLEADPADVVLDAERGVFHVAGTPAVAASWAELAKTEPLSAEVDYESAGSTFPSGAHACVVEVDSETGAVDIVRHVAVDDCGRVLAPMIVEGQVHGGVAQGISQALYEEFVYDDDGNPLTGSFADYLFPAATEIPNIERVPQETPTPVNPIGVKGIGESPTIGSPPAVQNAVIDALSHFGVRHIDMPLTPEKVWRAMVSRRKDTRARRAAGGAGAPKARRRRCP